MGTGSFPGVKSGRGVTLTPHPLLVPMGRMTCTEPQCLYKGALHLYLRVVLYLYSPNGLYDLYRASVPVQGCALPIFHLMLARCMNGFVCI